MRTRLFITAACTGDRSEPAAYLGIGGLQHRYGIKPTNNTNYWTTRLLHDGTPYSYKPPMAGGKMLYCMDRGYGYRWGTASFLNSYTYTSATGADADTGPENGAGAERHG